MKRHKKSFWYVWCSALGSKSHPDCNHTSDKVAIIRTLIFFSYFITNAFIIVGVIHNLNTPKCILDEKVSYSRKT
jgi:hypothetical protein